ncbi:hypothetical protein F5880DRAFT_1551933 [Lentinula raphanica]|nr:hypothetical protein F5880DRAFT_1551933 [Lentinula raphanica]
MFNSELILDTQTQMFWDYSIYFVELSIIVYDYLLTLDAEVERYWILRTRKDLTLSTALFFINRYLTLLGIFPIFVFTLWPEIIPGLMVSGSALLSGEGSAAWSVILQRCSRTLDLMHWIYIALEMSTVNLLFIIRTYALYGCHRWTWVFLGALWVCIWANSLWQLYLASKTNLEQPPFSGGQINCIAGDTRQQALYNVYSWAGIVIFDVCVFAMTLWKTLRMRGLFLRRGIGAMLMRDGAIYFGAVALLNSINILFFLFSSVDLHRLIYLLFSLC